jgi:murein L,D-transpeptidase YafK
MHSWVEVVRQPLKRAESDARRPALTAPLKARVAALVALLAIGAVAVSIAHHLVDRHVPSLLAERIGTARQIVVDKSERRMVLLNGDRVLKEYRIALGANPVAHKEIAGDSRTPEGEYTIDWRKADSEFHRALHVSYPNARDREFAAAIRRPPGGAIMIHGQPNDLGWLERLTRASDWTNGCIAVSNRAIEELWHAVPDGTPITIRP